MEEIPSKPYLIRALHEWCTDNGYTPYIIVNAGADTRVPQAHVRNGQITLNISALATQHLMLDNEHITFQARFGGVTEHVFVPTSAVMAIYARETGAGMGFEIVQAAQPDSANPASPKNPANTTNTAPPHVVKTVDAQHTGVKKPSSDDPPPSSGPPRRPKLTIVK